MPLQWCNQLWQSLEEGVDKECPFSGVTSYGRVWRKDAGKRCLRASSTHSNDVASYFSQKEEGGEGGSGGGGVGIQLPWVCQNTNITQQWIETSWGPFLVFIGSVRWLYDYPTSFLHLNCTLFFFSLS